MAPAVRAAVTAVAGHLPERVLSNEDLVAQFGTWSAEKISQKTGIDARHIGGPQEFTSDLAVAAAEELFQRTGRGRDDIDLVLLTTVTPDYLVPFTAGMIQDRLGLPTTTGAMDITLGCSGYVYGLGLAAGMIESGRARNVLLLTADRFSTFVDEAGQDVRSLFGDGAAATLIEAVPEGQTTTGGLIGTCRYGTDGSGAKNLLVPTSAVKGFAGAEEPHPGDKPVLHMEGAQVFDFTLRTVAPHIREVLADNELEVGDVDLFVFHHANLFMMEHLRRRLRISDEQFVVHIADVGNTISSSIPIAYDRAMQAGKVKPGSKVALVGFGVGYSWGTVLLDYPGG